MEPIDVLLDLLARTGAVRYGGEAVSQLEHALQCAMLAEADGAPAPLVAAALLHDVGHLLGPLGGEPASAAAREDSPSRENERHGGRRLRGHARHDESADRDSRHELSGARYLGRWFGPDVTTPVALHVQAKRYLCTVEPGYYAGLSAASRRSLELQGGRLAPAEVEGFLRRPHAAAALALRRWDDRAKVPGLGTPNLQHFRKYLDAALAPARPDCC